MIQPPVPFEPPTVLFVLPLFQSRFFFSSYLLLYTRDSPLPRDVTAAAEQCFKKIPSTSFLLFHLLQLSLSAILLLLSIDYWWVIILQS